MYINMDKHIVVLIYTYLFFIINQCLFTCEPSQSKPLENSNKNITPKTHFRHYPKFSKFLFPLSIITIIFVFVFVIMIIIVHRTLFIRTFRIQYAVRVCLGVWVWWEGLWGNRRMGRHRADQSRRLRPSGSWGLGGGWIPPFRASRVRTRRRGVVPRQMAASGWLPLVSLRDYYSAIVHKAVWIKNLI